MQQHNRKSQSPVRLAWQSGFTAGAAPLTAHCHTLVSPVVALAAMGRLASDIPLLGRVAALGDALT